MVAKVKNQKKLTRANSLKNKKEKKTTKASLEHAAARLLKIIDLPGGQINDPMSGKIYVSSVPPSNSLVSVSCVAYGTTEK